MRAEAEPPTCTRAYRPDIDGLRAFAILPVLLFHSGVPGFSGGYVGVDVFFVISGYLITGHLAREIAEDRFSILRFYARRVQRIAPALFVTLVMTWAFSTLLFLPSYLIDASRAMAAAAASVSNIYLWKWSGYFEPDSAFQPYLHTWSLSVEEQFYACIPVVMLIAARLLRRRWLLLFIPICLVSFALSVWMTTAGPTANFYLLPTRAWELGIGSVIGTTRLPPIRRRWLADLLGLVGLLLLVLPVYLFDDGTPFPGLNALYPCLGAALIIVVGRNLVSQVTRLLCVPPLVWVGRISYSLYLVHWPIIVFVHYDTVAPLTALQAAGVIIGSMLLAALLWRFVEQPFRQRSYAITQPRLLWGGLSTILLACGIGWIGVLGNGFPARFPDFVEQTIPGHADWKPGRCFLLGNPDVRQWSLSDCTRIATGPRKVLLWGDSFAAQYVPGILANANALQATVIQHTAAGCPPVLSYRSYARTLCTSFNRHALDLVTEQHVDTVILAGRWTDMRSRGLNEIRSTLDALDSLGVTVIMVGQSPEFAEDVQVIAFLKGSKQPNAVNRWPVFSNGSLNRQLAAVAGHHRFINPMPAFCDDQTCIYQDHGVFLFEDYGHFSRQGSDRAVRALLMTGPEG